MKFKERLLGLINYYYNKWQFRAILLLTAILNIVGVVLFVQFLSNELIEREISMIQTSASIYKSITMNFNNPSNNADDLFSVLNEVNNNISFPVVLTDPNDKPNFPYKSNSLNVKLDSNKTNEQQLEYMVKLVEEMKSNYEPIVVSDNDGMVLLKLFYTHTNLIDYLRFFPVLALLVIIGLTISGYIIFNNIRDNQEKMVWVGMSKEAAHQMGTPLSSLMAWVEILKIRVNEESAKETLAEIDKDVSRLETIAYRFSKIGSKPELKNTNVSKIISNTKKYFESRLPHLGKKVEIEGNFDRMQVNAQINDLLFTWVLENLIKNAAESIESKKGKINILINQSGDKVLIEVSDNGKGMNSSTVKQIFNPGFTTKTRGWGLGLSLCKRIIEQYHNGRIYVLKSVVGKGTTFRIELIW